MQHYLHTVVEFDDSGSASVTANFTENCHMHATEMLLFYMHVYESACLGEI